MERAARAAGAADVDADGREAERAARSACSVAATAGFGRRVAGVLDHRRVRTVLGRAGQRDVDREQRPVARLQVAVAGPIVLRRVERRRPAARSDAVTSTAALTVSVIGDAVTARPVGTSRKMRLPCASAVCVVDEPVVCGRRGAARSPRRAPVSQTCSTLPCVTNVAGSAPREIDEVARCRGVVAGRRRPSTRRARRASAHATRQSPRTTTQSRGSHERREANASTCRGWSARRAGVTRYAQRRSAGEEVLRTFAPRRRRRARRGTVAARSDRGSGTPRAATQIGQWCSTRTSVAVVVLDDFGQIALVGADCGRAPRRGRAAAPRLGIAGRYAASWASARASMTASSPSSPSARRIASSRSTVRSSW